MRREVIGIVGVAVMLLLAMPAVAQFQTCVFCDVNPFNPDPYPVTACTSGTLVINGIGYNDTNQNGCSAVPDVAVRSTRPDRLTIVAFRVMSDRSIEFDYSVPCDATDGLTGIDVTIDDDPNDTTMPYACGNARILVESIPLAVEFDGYTATKVVGGVDISFTTLAENRTLAFEVWARGTFGETRLPDLVYATGSASQYAVQDRSDAAANGQVEAYRLVERTLDGTVGDLSAWFPVTGGPITIGGTSGSRDRRNGRR